MSGVSPSGSDGRCRPVGWGGSAGGKGEDQQRHTERCTDCTTNPSGADEATVGIRARIAIDFSQGVASHHEGNAAENDAADEERQNAEY